MCFVPSRISLETLHLWGTHSVNAGSHAFEQKHIRNKPNMDNNECTKDFHMYMDGYESIWIHGYRWISVDIGGWILILI